jgi:hypothetical protein
VGAAGYEFSSVLPVLPAFTLFATDHQYGYGRVSISPSGTTSNLKFSFVESATGNIVDSVSLSKKI